MLSASGCHIINTFDPPAPRVREVTLLERSDTHTQTTVLLGVSYTDPHWSLSEVTVSYRFESGLSGQRNFVPIVDDDVLSGFTRSNMEGNEGGGTIRRVITWNIESYIDYNISLSTLEGKRGPYKSIRIEKP